MKMQPEVQGVAKSGMRTNPQQDDDQVWLVTIAMTRQQAEAMPIGTQVDVFRLADRK